MKLFNQIVAVLVLLLVIPACAYMLYHMGYDVHKIILACGFVAVIFALLLNIHWVGLRKEKPCTVAKDKKK